MSDLKDLTLWTLWESPYGQKKVSLWEWLEMSDLIKPYQNEWNRWDLNELKWIERFEMIWVNWRKWARTTLWESPYGQKKVSLSKWLEWIQWESPYELRMNVPINLTWLISVRKSLCSVEWMSLSKWLRTTLWESPYGRLRVSLSKWLEWSQWESPYQNDEIWLNRGKISE